MQEQEVYKGRMDSGIFVSPLSIQNPPNSSCPSGTFPTPSSTQPSQTGLIQQQNPQNSLQQHQWQVANNTIDTIEFICYSIHRIWHKSPHTAFSLPQEALEWFPHFMNCTRRLYSFVSIPFSLTRMALLYVARLKHALPDCTLSQGSEYKILVSAIILAHKFHSDERYKNSTWAGWAGLTTLDVNTMEREFMEGIGGRLFIKEREYQLWKSSIQVLAQEYLVSKKVSDLDAQVLDKGLLLEDDLDVNHGLQRIKRPITLSSHDRLRNGLPRAKTWTKSK